MKCTSSPPRAVSHLNAPLHYMEPAATDLFYLFFFSAFKIFLQLGWCSGRDAQKLLVKMFSRQRFISPILHHDSPKRQVFELDEEDSFVCSGGRTTLKTRQRRSGVSEKNKVYQTVLCSAEIPSQPSVCFVYLHSGLFFFREGFLRLLTFIIYPLLI